MKKLLVALGMLLGISFAQCCVPCQTCVSGYVVMYPGTYVPNVCNNPCCDCCCSCSPGCIYGPVNCPTCMPTCPPNESIVINQVAN